MERSRLRICDARHVDLFDRPILMIANSFTLIDPKSQI